MGGAASLGLVSRPCSACRCAMGFAAGRALCLGGGAVSWGLLIRAWCGWRRDIRIGDQGCSGWRCVLGIADQGVAWVVCHW